MKLKLLTVGLLAAFAVQASATIVNLSGGPTGFTFTDNAGAPLPNGTPVEIGRIDGGAFVPLGAGAITTVFGNAGKWSGTAALNTAAGDAFNNQQIWGKISFGGADLVFTATGNADWQFKPNAGGVGDTSNPNSNQIDTIEPTLSTPGFALGGGSVAMGVPEPSTSLLAGLAGLALLIRRKR